MRLCKARAKRTRLKMMEEKLISEILDSSLKYRINVIIKQSITIFSITLYERRLIVTSPALHFTFQEHCRTLQM
jgi:hypothetical protein